MWRVMDAPALCLRGSAFKFLEAGLNRLGCVPWN